MTAKLYITATANRERNGHPRKAIAHGEPLLFPSVGTALNYAQRYTAFVLDWCGPDGANGNEWASSFTNPDTGVVYHFRVIKLSNPQERWGGVVNDPLPDPFGANVTWSSVATPTF